MKTSRTYLEVQRNIGSVLEQIGTYYCYYYSLEILYGTRNWKPGLGHPQTGVSWIPMDIRKPHGCPLASATWTSATKLVLGHPHLDLQQPRQHAESFRPLIG